MIRFAVVVLLASAAAPLVEAQDSTAKARRPAGALLSPLETAVLEELNRVRSDPAGYAALLEAILPEFEGTVRRRPGTSVLLRTREGAAAVQEAIEALRQTAPMAVLRVSRGLTAAARDLAHDQEASGTVGHDGSDGSDPLVRANRHGTVEMGMSENVSYGMSDARDVLLQLLVDDGVASRGHRRNILDARMRLVGVGCAAHPRFRTVCVMNHAVGYEERD